MHVERERGWDSVEGEGGSGTFLREEELMSLCREKEELLQILRGALEHLT